MTPTPLAPVPDADDDDDVLPFHLRPARRRGAYDPRPRAAHAATVDEAVEAMLRQRGDWREPTRRNCRHYLGGRRWRMFCTAAGIVTIDQLTTDHVEQFMEQQRTLISPKTREGYRRYLRALSIFQAEVPGYGSGLASIDRVRRPPMPRRPRTAPALSREEEEILVRTAKPGRDRLVVELLLATGVRVSELCALTAGDLHIGTGPAWLHVRGSTWDPDLTKSAEDRKVPFRTHYRTLPGRLREHITAATRGSADRLFVSQRGLDEHGRAASLSIVGVQQILKRLGDRVGFAVHPHLCRHTWATRCVDGGIPIFSLQQAGGWKSIEMVQRYYRADAREMLDAFARSKC